MLSDMLEQTISLDVICPMKVLKDIKQRFVCVYLLAHIKVYLVIMLEEYMGGLSSII